MNDLERPSIGYEPEWYQGDLDVAGTLTVGWSANSTNFTALEHQIQSWYYTKSYNVEITTSKGLIKVTFDWKDNGYLHVNTILFFLMHLIDLPGLQPFSIEYFQDLRPHPY